MGGPTFLDLAASIDRVLHRNTQSPDQTFTVGTYAVTPLMHTLLGNATGGNIIFNLPTAVGLAGMRFTFKKVDSSANTLTINAAGLETIDGSSSFAMVQPNEAVEIESDGANWKILTNFVTAGSPSFANLDIKSVIKTDNDFSSLNPVTGTTIVFTTTRDGVSYLSCSAFTSGLSFGPYSASIGINVDGTDYTLFVDAQNNGAGGDFTANMGYAGSIGVPLLAGVHTAYVFVTQSVIGFQATVGAPLTLSVIYPSLSGATAAAAPLAFQEATSAAGGSATTTSTTFVPIPGTSISIPLISNQTIFFSGTATSLHYAVTDQTVTYIGLRVDGTDYPGTTPESDFGNRVNQSLVVTKALTLGPGTHTAELVYRTTTPTVPAAVFTSATQPARLTAIYTVPQALLNITTGTGLESTGTRKTDGNFAVPTAVTVVPGTNTAFTTGAAGKTIVSVSGSIFAAANTANDFTATIGIRIDGATDFFFPYSDGVSGWDPTGGHNGAEGLHLGGTIPLDLSIGAHTVDIIIAASDGVGGAPWTLNANASKPACIDVIYPVYVVLPGNMSMSQVSATGATVDAYVTIANVTSAIGVDGFGTIKNTGANSMDVKETGVDLFGPTTDSQTTVVAPGNFLVLTARNVCTTAVPPYTNYSIDVRSTVPGSPTNYDLKFLSEVAP